MYMKAQTNFIDVVKNTISNNGQSIEERLEEKHKGFEKGWKMDGNEVVFWVSPTLRLSEYTGSIMNEFRFTLLFDEENKKLIVSGNNVKSRNLL
ncbi:hypothetical protein ACNA06_06950 [Lysinibacillus sp. RSDA_15]|nr:MULTISPECIES: hypothetical protein [Lysinibacillus]MBG9689731.1 hypothetical protein [Lysinibacillus sphaericus]MBG9757143.1 hypothetical protein [Lysinibacillus sphaericus]MEB7453280.1 hypothetical protein [Lysinibacillus sphaericus]QTB24451.1 hypothetical protein J1907_10615 [Lysinibacillus sphaericus]QTB25262.1 hypothetical protein J2D51_12955 [Lysinibacillus sphaericus]